MRQEIIPAIIAKNQEELNLAIEKVKDFANIVQLDFMDGKFVDNASIDFDFNLLKTNCIFEAHLMIKEPLKWIKKNYSKVDVILVHYESCDNLDEIITFVKENRKKAGIVINPDTSVEKIMDYLKKIDQVLVMTVNPGFYGSPFLEETLAKCTEIRRLSPNLNIEVDGGITDKTIKKAADAGANFFVSGSYILKAENPRSSFGILKKLCR